MLKLIYAILVFMFLPIMDAKADWRMDTDGSGDMGWWEGQVCKGCWYKATSTYRECVNGVWAEKVVPFDLYSNSPTLHWSDSNVNVFKAVNSIPQNQVVKAEPDTKTETFIKTEPQGEWRMDTNDSGDMGWWVGHDCRGVWEKSTNTYRARKDGVWEDTTVPFNPYPNSKSTVNWSEPVTQPTIVQSDSALTEVNSARAQRGLRPFIHDPNLTAAAASCAEFRASRHIQGHTSNDFQALPSGTMASAAGCGALEPSWGWGTCCTYENHTYAGAAVVMGNDGRRYMHLFVR